MEHVGQSRSFAYPYDEDTSAQNLLDAEHELMAALVPARPPEEEEEEEEEKVNHAMEREPTGMDGDDIRSDMEYEYTNAQSLDDPDHTTMAALVQAPQAGDDTSQIRVAFDVQSENDGQLKFSQSSMQQDAPNQMPHRHAGSIDGTGEEKISENSIYFGGYQMRWNISQLRKRRSKSEQVFLTGENPDKAISKEVQHGGSLREPQEILVGDGPWQATQPSHETDESVPPQPILAGPRYPFRGPISRR
ncbi:hypothetical protein AKAW_11211 [Aspergillus luchuensis IFO 4308]|nr:hypothetical protein AKAW_11211 [Aspergillus luchuensis IFO 4308]